MRKLIRLFFIGLFLFLGYKFLESKDIKVKDWIEEGRDWAEKTLEDFQEADSSAEEAADLPGRQPMEEPASPKLPYNATSESNLQTRLQTTQSRTGPAENVQKQDSEEVSKRSQKIESYKSKGDILPTDNFEWIKATTEQHSPNSWYLLMKYEQLPAKSEATLADGGVISSSKPVGTFHYLTGSSKLDLLGSMETNVHEIAHGYFRQNSYKYANEQDIFLNWDHAEGFIYLSPTESYFVSFPNESLFPARKLAAVISNRLRTFRFNTYIEGISSTQGEGVIGMLNELHAYYLGSNYCYDMLNSYQNALESDCTGLLEWVTHTMSSMSAFYEFDFFIKEYLLYMRNNHPSDYSGIKSTHSFKQAYSAVFKVYKNLTRDYQELIDSEMQRINASGSAEVSIRDGLLWVRPVHSSTSTGTHIFSEDREKLIGVLASDRYQEIEQDFLR